MKTLLFSVLSFAGLASLADAQVLSERAARNVLIGGVAGAIIGENNHHRAAEGAVIGAAAGLIWTAATENRRSDVVYTSTDCAPPVTRVIVSEPCRPARTVVVHRPVRTVVVHRPAERVVVREDRHHVRHVHRKVVRVVEPGCSPRFVEVID